jgi:hypothetical protein
MDFCSDCGGFSSMRAGLEHIWRTERLHVVGATWRCEG